MIHREINCGYSATERSINGYVFQKKEGLPAIFVIAGVHGDEQEGIWLAEYFKSLWEQNFFYKHIKVILIPEANPDGVMLNTRLNANGVDLNRNLPTKDWNAKAFNERYPPGPYACSEPESEAMVDLIRKYQPKGILTLHSYHTPQLNANGYDKTGVMDLVNTLSKVSPYQLITRGDEIGYPAPGCLGTYAGYERDIPTITYELFRGDPKEKILMENIAVVKAFVQYFNQKFSK